MVASLSANRTTAAAKAIATCLILSISMQMCYGSAIPIWEFLTRTEKLSHLYSTFGLLVSVHCKATAATSGVPVNQCKRNLLTYGSERLQSFTDAQLDAIDPYQRGGSELIWSSIMHDHPSATLITTRKPLPTPPSSSIVILTHQRPAGVGSTTTAGQHSQSTQFAKNPLFDSDGADRKHQYAMEMDQSYGGYTGAASTQSATSYLSGPLVFRVRPDGTPVEEDQYHSLPRDDDLEAFGRFSQSISGAEESVTLSPSSPNSNGRRHKHRKIATISALKQQRLATLALQKQLPPVDETRTRRHFQFGQTPSLGYFYAKGQS